jgi:hypothetical protein
MGWEGREGEGKIEKSRRKKGKEEGRWERERGSEMEKRSKGKREGERSLRNSSVSRRAGLAP